MADFLVYWKGFWDDTDGDLAGIDEGWYTKNESLYKDAGPGDVLWVVISGGPAAPEEWRLLQRVVVLRRDSARATSKYGPYHLIPDDERSAIYDPKHQPDLAPTLKKLMFTTKKQIAAEGALIGRTLQVARKLASVDRSVLEEYAAKLVTV
jgi:hypothetical protein